MATKKTSTATKKVIPVKEVKEFKRWSYSSLKNYERCPHYAYQAHVLRDRGESGEGAKRGNAIHEAAEKFLKLDPKQPVPPPLFRHRVFRGELAHLLAVGATPEQDWTFSKRGDLVEDGTPDAWLRIKIDHHYVDGDWLVVGDFKTGKVYDDHHEQLNLYATWTLLKMNTERARAKQPLIKGVRGELWYLDQAVLMRGQDRLGNKLEWTASELFGAAKTWQQRVEPMFADRVFSPTPNKYCYNCHLSRKNGGKCRY